MALNGMRDEDEDGNGPPAAASPAGCKPVAKRARKATAAANTGEADQVTGVGVLEEVAPRPKVKRSRKKPAAAAALDGADAGEQNGAEAAAGDADPESGSAKKPTAKRRKKAQAAEAAAGDDEEGAEEGDADADEAAAAKPKKKRAAKVTWPPGAMPAVAGDPCGQRRLMQTRQHHQ